jgi:hypothetical protein
MSVLASKRGNVGEINNGRSPGPPNLEAVGYTYPDLSTIDLHRTRPNARSYSIL